MNLFALNLFDLADNDDYLEYSRRSLGAVREYGGSVVALGKLAPDAPVSQGDTAPRQAMVLVEWASPGVFQGLPRRSRQRGPAPAARERPPQLPLVGLREARGSAPATEALVR